MTEAEEQKAVEEVYKFAMDMKISGKSDFEIQQALQESGLDELSSRTIVQNVNNSIAENGVEDEGSGYGWLIWIGLLIGINVLSAIFDWPFWIY